MRRTQRALVFRKLPSLSRFGVRTQRPVTFPPLRKGVPSPRGVPGTPESTQRKSRPPPVLGSRPASQGVSHKPRKQGSQRKQPKNQKGAEQKAPRTSHLPEAGILRKKPLAGSASWPTRPDTRVPHERVITKEMRCIASCLEGQKDAVRQAFQPPRSTYATCSVPMNSSSEEPSQG